MHFTTALSIVTAVLATTATATHKLGSSCGGKHVGTLGCSNDDCTVVSTYLQRLPGRVTSGDATPHVIL